MGDSCDYDFKEDHDSSPVVVKGLTDDEGERLHQLGYEAGRVTMKEEDAAFLLTKAAERFRRGDDSIARELRDLSREMSLEAHKLRIEHEANRDGDRFKKQV